MNSGFKGNSSLSPFLCIEVVVTDRTAPPVDIPPRRLPWATAARESPWASLEKPQGNIPTPGRGGAAWPLTLLVCRGLEAQGRDECGLGGRLGEG